MNFIITVGDKTVLALNEHWFLFCTDIAASDDVPYIEASPYVQNDVACSVKSAYPSNQLRYSWYLDNVGPLESTTRDIKVPGFRTVQFNDRWRLTCTASLPDFGCKS